MEKQFSTALEHNQEIDMTMYKNVNGVDVKLTSREESKVRAEWAANEATQDKIKWLVSRVEQYNEAFGVTDQIDIIQKQFQSMINLGEITVVPEAQAWLDKIEQIKASSPKPTE